ncbi:MAG: glycosyltransferase [Bacillota bacterium]|nr:glycosyltransferase [Bacillota bacterium]
MKFSIIIATYNRPNLLSGTLMYLNKQKINLNDIEVVVIDDGSDNDDTKELVRNFSAKFSLNYFYLEKTEASCVSRARNEGIKKAKGEIIIFLDDDIIVRDDFLLEILRYQMLYDNLLIVGYRKLLNEEETGLLQSKPELAEQIFTNSEMGPRHTLFRECSFNMKNTIDPWINVYGYCICVKRSYIIKNNLYFNSAYKTWGPEDMDLAYRFYINGFKIVVNHKLEVYHQYHGNYHKYIMDPEKSRYAKVADFIFKELYGFSLAEKMAALWKTVLMSGKLKKIETGEIEAKIVIFQDKLRTEEVKAYVLKELALNPGHQLIIYDKTDSNLDLWVQIIEIEAEHYPMYFPASNILSRKVKEMIEAREVQQVAF